MMDNYKQDLAGLVPVLPRTPEKLLDHWNGYVSSVGLGGKMELLGVKELRSCSGSSVHVVL